jgi:gluconolactonase
MFTNMAISKKKEGDLFTKGAKPEKLAGDFQFTEGPACDRKGNIFFTDQPNNRIMKWSTDNHLSILGENYGRANGMYFDKKGNLISCSDEKNELWSIAPDGKVTVLVKDYDGKKLNGPNDLWISPKGGIYLTDPFYKRPWWSHDSMEQDGQHVYYLAPGASKLVRVVSDLEKPNGIIGTPDGKYLYIADIKGNKTWRYSIPFSVQAGN